MIQQSELRLGNWLRNFLGEEFQVVMIPISPTFPAPEPIPLTPEWAFKFGFKKTDEYEYTLELFQGLAKFELVIVPGIHDCPITVYNYAIQCITLRSVTYVHHLQNYVFGLLRTELTLQDGPNPTK